MKEQTYYLVFTVDRIPDLTLTKYSVLDGSSVDDIMDKHGVFLRQLHRLGSTSGVYFHLLYYFDPDERIPKGHHLSVVFYATSRDRRKLEGIREFLTTSVLSTYYDFHCYEVSTDFCPETLLTSDKRTENVIMLTNVAGQKKTYGIHASNVADVSSYKHKLEIDPSAGSVVQDIFKMKLQGMSQDAIANRLNELGILSPFEYKISNGSRYETGFRQKEQALWSSVTVRRILENEVYIGNLVQGKRTTPNHKVKQTYVKPEDDWIRIEKNHEPLVSDRDFEIVQRLLGMDTRTSPDQKQVYLLSGIAVCADCGAPMTRKVSTVAGKKYAYYLCSANKETKRCSSHRIPEKDLEDAVLVMLKQHIQNILHLKRVLEFVGTVPFQEINMKKLQDRLEKKKQETERCKELRMMLYSDMKEGIVSKEDYVELHAAYGKRLRNAEESIRAIQKEMDSELEKADNANTWLDYFVKYQDIEELSRTVVVELIRKIRVYDKKNIEITFDFDDCYQTLLNQLPAMGVDTVVDDDNNLQVKVKEVV